MNRIIPLLLFLCFFFSSLKSGILTFVTNIDLELIIQGTCVPHGSTKKNGENSSIVATCVSFYKMIHIKKDIPAIFELPLIAPDVAIDALFVFFPGRTSEELRELDHEDGKLDLTHCKEKNTRITVLLQGSSA